MPTPYQLSATATAISFGTPNDTSTRNPPRGDVTTPTFAQFPEHLGSFARVDTVDKRRPGKTDRVEGTPTVNERIDDVTCRLDAADVERAILVGWFDAAAILAVCALRHPDCVGGLELGAPR